MPTTTIAQRVTAGLSKAGAGSCKPDPEAGAAVFEIKDRRQTQKMARQNADSGAEAKAEDEAVKVWCFNSRERGRQRAADKDVQNEANKTRAGSVARCKRGGSRAANDGQSACANDAVFDVMCGAN